MFGSLFASSHKSPHHRSVTANTAFSNLNQSIFVVLHLLALSQPTFAEGNSPRSCRTNSSSTTSTSFCSPSSPNTFLHFSPSCHHTQHHSLLAKNFKHYHSFSEKFDYPDAWHRSPSSSIRPVTVTSHSLRGPTSNVCSLRVYDGENWSDDFAVGRVRPPGSGRSDHIVGCLLLLWLVSHWRRPRR